MAETDAKTACDPAKTEIQNTLQSAEVQIRPWSSADVCEGTGDCPSQRPVQTQTGARVASPRQKQRAVVKRAVVRAETLPAASSASTPSLYVRPQPRPVSDQVVPDVDPT